MSEVIIGEGPVLLTLGDGVADLRLNRPEASNGMDIALLRALHEALLWLHGEARVRAVILSGNGPNFCAGGDVKTFAAQGERLPDYLREATAWLGAVTTALIRLPAPVIAAVHGYAAGGGGFGLVCACDLVVAADSARLLTGATRVGMAPDAGTTVTLPRIVGMRKAMELLLTNPTLSAAEALELGIVTQVVQMTSCAARPRRWPASSCAGRLEHWPRPSDCCGTGSGARLNSVFLTRPAPSRGWAAPPTHVKGWRL